MKTIDTKRLPTSGIVRSDSAQTLTPAEKGRARANISAGVLTGFRNKIINGDFDIWQRGTVFAASVGTRYTADRWRVTAVGSTVAVSNPGFPLGAGQGGAKSAMQLEVVSVAGASNYVALVQGIEGVRTLAGKKATLTFYATSSGGATAMSTELMQAFGTGGSPSSSTLGIGARKHTLTGSWQKISYVIDIPSIVGKTIGSNGDDCLQVAFWFDSGSSYNSRNDSLGQQSGSFFVTHVSLVEGDATTEDDPFEPRHPIQEEILCKRYFERLSGYGLCAGQVRHSTQALLYLQWIQKRGSPTVTADYAGMGIYAGNVVIAATSFGTDGIQRDRCRIVLGITGGTTGHAAELRATGTNIDIDAEI